MATKALFDPTLTIEITILTITACLGIALLVCTAGKCIYVRESNYLREYVRDESNLKSLAQALPFMNRRGQEGVCAINEQLPVLPILACNYPIYKQ